MEKRNISRVMAIGAMLTISTILGAQCALFDFFGNATDTPTWYHCSGGTYTLNIQSPDDIGNYSIDWGDGSTSSGGPFSPPTTITHTYAPAVETYTIVFTDLSTGCTTTGTLIMEEATSASIQIPVGGLTQACAPQAMEFTNSSTNVSDNTIFTWDFGDGSPAQTFDHTNWNQIVSHTYERNTVDCETVVTLTAGNQCNAIQGGNSNATFNPIRIWDYDDAAITPSANVLCWPDNTVELNNTSEMNCFNQGNVAQRYEYWNLGDYWGLGYDSIVDWAPWPPTFARTISFPAIGDYEVMLLDSNFCGIDTAYTTISIVPPPTAGVTIDEDTICQGGAVTFVNASSAEANAWQINYGEGVGWQIGGGTQVTHVYNTPGLYEVGFVAYVSGAGAACTDTVWVDVVVEPGPVATIGLSDNEACGSLSTSVSNNSTNANEWNWNMGNGNTYTIESPPIQEYTTPGLYTITLNVTAANGCSDNTSAQVEIHHIPEAVFSTSSVCLGEEASFFDGSTVGGGVPINAWNWNFDDGAIALDQNPEHLFAIGGDYDVTLSASTPHCSDDTTVTLTIDTPPTADFDMDIDTGCSPLEVSFTNTSVGGATYTWFFGDGAASMDTSTVHTYNNQTPNDTTYTVTLVARNSFGCADTLRQTVAVASQTTAAFTSNATPGCAPYTASFYNSSLNADSYIWDFGDGSPTTTDPDPSHLFENTTQFIQNYEVTLVALNTQGCHDTISQTVISYPEPDFNFDLTSFSGCAPLSVQFPIIANAVSYSWDFGDGNTATGPTPTHFYQNAGVTTADYQVRLIASNAFGCVDTAYSDISIFPTPVAQFTTDVASGCSPLTVEITDQSVLSDVSRWVYGIGDTAIVVPSPHTHLYTNTTTAPRSETIQLEVTSVHGCVSTASAPINVFPEVHADFTTIGAGCTPLEVTYDNTTIGGSSYEWHFGDGLIGIEEEPTHTFFNSGLADTTFTTQLIATSTFGCVDTSAADIIVHHRAIAEVTVDEVQGCSPLTVLLDNGSQGATDYLWDYGNGTQSDTAAVAHSITFTNDTDQPQLMSITLTATTDFGCADTDAINVSVYPRVEAGLMAIEEGCSPLEVSFSNTSTGATDYSWAFGDGLVSSAESPTHTYINNTLTDTVYTALLTVSSIYGCQDTVTHDVAVHHLPQVDFMVSATEGCSPLTVTLDNETQGATDYLWDYDNGTQSDTLASTHDIIFVNDTDQPQLMNITLTATTTLGCTGADDVNVTVFPGIEAGLTAIEEGCSPLEVSFQNTSTGADDYTWAFGDGSVSSAESPEHTYLNTTLTDTVYTALLTVTSSFGCQDTMTQEVAVYHLPQADFEVSAIEGCTPLTVTYSNMSQGGDIYAWNYGDGRSSDTTAVAHDITYISTNAQPMTVTVDLLVTTDRGCVDTDEVEITVYPEIVANFVSDTALCSGDEFVFFNQSTGAALYEWTFGEGGSSDDNDPSYIYDNVSGTDLDMEVRLIATSIYGCVDSITNGVTVYTAPIAEIAIDSSSVCYPLYIEFANNSLYATDFLWDYGDGQGSDTTAALHSHIFTNSTTNVVEYDILLTATTINGCEAEATTSVEVIPPLEADFQSVTEGCHPLTVAFDNTSDNALTFEWTYGDDTSGDAVADPIHTFNNFGITDEIFTVTLVAESFFGCKDSVSVDITVFPLPDAEFIPTPVFQVYPDATVDIEDVSVAGSAVYQWDMGDGTTSNDPLFSTHTYGTWGSYEMSLTIDNGQCSDQTIQVIEIQAPAPIAAFTGLAEGCAPVTVSFTNESEFSTNYLWNFGDGGTSSNESPTYTFHAPGTYTVSLLSTGPGGSDITIAEQEIQVYPNANAYYTVNPPVTQTGKPVFFYNLSNNATEFIWDFGDGGVSADNSPTYVYETTGAFEVTLVANNEYNCPDTFRLADAVLVDVGGFVDFPNAFTPNAGAGGDGRYDPTQLDNDVFHPVFAGVDDYSLQVYNRWGELLFESNDINRGWDGTYRGTVAQQGVYVWRAKVTFTDGKQKVLAGDLTLLR